MDRMRKLAYVFVFALAALPQATFGEPLQRTVRIAAVNSEDGKVTSVDLAVSHAIRRAWCRRPWRGHDRLGFH